MISNRSILLTKGSQEYEGLYETLSMFLALINAYQVNRNPEQKKFLGIIARKFAGFGRTEGEGSHARASDRHQPNAHAEKASRQATRSQG